MPNSVFEGLDEIIERQKQAEERSRKEHEEIYKNFDPADDRGQPAGRSGPECQRRGLHRL